MKIVNFALYGSLILVAGCNTSANNRNSSSCPDVKFPSADEIEKMSTSMIRIKYRTAEVEKEAAIYSTPLGGKMCAGEGLYADAWRSILVDRLKNESIGLSR